MKKVLHRPLARIIAELEETERVLFDIDNGNDDEPNKATESAMLIDAQRDLASARLTLLAIIDPVPDTVWPARHEPSPEAEAAIAAESAKWGEGLKLLQNSADASLEADRSQRAMEAFHEHLDACKQCREQPFNLCAVGSKLIAEMAPPADDAEKV